jgi:hypothetical protein
LDEIDECFCSFEYWIKIGQYSTAMDVDIAVYQDVHLAPDPLRVHDRHLFGLLRSGSGQNLIGLETLSGKIVNEIMQLEHTGTSQLRRIPPV